MEPPGRSRTRYAVRVIYTVTFSLCILGTFTIADHWGAVAAGAGAALALICYVQSMTAQSQAEVCDFYRTEVEYWQQNSIDARAQLLAQEQEYDNIMRRAGLS